MCIAQDAEQTSTNLFFEGEMMSDLEKQLPIELEKQLMALGLTNYQARVYRAVFILKECSISQIANFSKVPTAKVYSTVSDLKEMGLLAEILKTRPAMFKAYSPDQYIEREKNKIVAIGDQIKENLATLEKFRKEKSRPEAPETLIVENDLLIKNLILDGLKSLPKNIIVLLQNDFDFYEQILNRLFMGVKQTEVSNTITVILVDPYKRQLQFLKKFTELNYELITTEQLSPDFVDSLKSLPLLIIIDDTSFINIQKTEQTLKYLSLKSEYFANFLRTSIINKITNV